MTSDNVLSLSKVFLSISMLAAHFLSVTLEIYPHIILKASQLQICEASKSVLSLFKWTLS